MFPEHPVHELADLRRRASDMCASLRSRIAQVCGGSGDLEAPEVYAALSTEKTSSTPYTELPTELRRVARTIAAEKAELLPLYNRFALAWLIRHCDPSRAALQLPRSILAIYPLHFARILRQMEELDERDYDLARDNYVKDLGILRFQLFPISDRLVDVHPGVSRSIVWRGGLAQALRALWLLSVRFRGIGPVLIHHVHNLIGSSNDRDVVISHHRLADLIEANAHLKALAGESWMLDPALEFITPHHSLKWRLTVRNGGYLFRSGRDDESTAMALKKSKTRRLLYAEGRYVPTKYIRIWPREAMMRWSVRSRPESWGPVGMDSRVPPPERLGRTR